MYMRPQLKKWQITQNMKNQGHQSIEVIPKFCRKNLKTKTDQQVDENWQ